MNGIAFFSAVWDKCPPRHLSRTINLGFNSRMTGYGSRWLKMGKNKNPEHVWTGGAAVVSHNCEKDVPARAFQNKMYGKGKVIANTCKDGAHRCTICGSKV